MSESSSANKTSVCFVSFDATRLIFPNAAGSIGGAETRALLLAKILSANPEMCVSIVVRDTRYRPVKTVDGLTAVTYVDRLFRIRRFVSEHVTVLRSFPWLRIRIWHPKLIWQIPLLFLVKLFRRSSQGTGTFDWLVPVVDADIYCCMGVSNRTADIFDAVRSRQRKTILFIASNADLDERYCQSAAFIGLNGDMGDRCVSAIQAANVIVCQTDVQAELLRNRFCRDSYCFPNPFDYERWMTRLQSHQELAAQIPSRFALWIGRSDRHHKRPELLLQVANLCPEVSFVMVMNTQDEVVASDIRRLCPSNVLLIESVALDDMPAYFERAAMFVSTSSQDLEGFPNVFLQASATLVPIVSLEADPGFITVENAGVVCHGDIERLAVEVRTLWSNPSQAKQLGENGRRYVRRRHSIADSHSRMREIMNAVLR